MFQLTEEKFEELLEENEHILYSCGDWFPTLQEIKTHIEPHMDSLAVVKFALWILETSNPSSPSVDKEARRYLMNLIYNSIEYPEDVEENEDSENSEHLEEPEEIEEVSCPNENNK